jgi:hypothetical protein
VVRIVSTFAGEARNTLLDALAKDSSLLEDITRNFRSQLDDYHFVSFFETRKMSKSRGIMGLVKMVRATRKSNSSPALITYKTVVSAESATLGLSSQREHQVGLDADHSAICKIASDGDEYRLISTNLLSLIARAIPGQTSLSRPTSIAAEHSLDKPPTQAIQTPSVTEGSEDYGKSPQADVLLHEGFGSWLDSFRNPSAPKISRPALPESGTTKSEKTAMTANAVDYDRSGSSLRLSPADATAAHGVQFTVQMPRISGDTPISLIISGYRKPGPHGQKLPITLKVVAGLETRIDELIHVLTRHGKSPFVLQMLYPLITYVCTGFDSMEGLHCPQTGIARGPMTHVTVPSPVLVTDGPSCYEFEKGYKINTEESFESFYVRRYEQPISVTVHQDQLYVQGGSRSSWNGIRIRFMRTLRIPEDGRNYDLPAGFGPFPLSNTNHYQHKLPSAMGAKGGVFFPMLQREAMWIAFESSPRDDIYAVRVRVGGVNAITGQAWSPADRDHEQPKRQDYLVAPGQKWLDGIASGSNTVHQFVAMPIGSGYSVEKQVCGSENIAGLQLEIFPRRPDPKDRHSWYSPQSGWAVTIKQSASEAYGDYISKADSPNQHRLKPGDFVFLHDHQREVPPLQHYLPLFPSNQQKAESYVGLTANECRAPIVREFFYKTSQPHDRLSLKAIHGAYCINFLSDEAPRESRKKSKLSSKTLRASILCSPFLDLGSLAAALLRQIIERNSGEMYESDLILHVKDKLLEPLRYSRGQIFDEGFRDGDQIVVDLYRKLKKTKGLGGGIKVNKTWGSIQFEPREARKNEDGWDMGFAPGGKIKQAIYKDQDPEVWDFGRARLLNIQILNSVAFEAVTGKKTPDSPISAEDYKRHGIPFFSHTEAQALEIGPITGLRSVAEMDSARGPIPDNLVSPFKPTVCRMCQERLCTVL